MDRIRIERETMYLDIWDNIKNGIALPENSDIKDRYEYENLEDNKPTYYSLGASYNKNASRFSVSYGKQRGGLLCYGGICRYIPEFKGLSFSINTSF